MLKESYSSERGQAIVLIALALVALLGFTALAIDGSMIYADRRYAQNAADAASLSGGGAAPLALENSGVTFGAWQNCTNGLINGAITAANNAAISAAANNAYNIDFDADVEPVGNVDNGFVDVQCGVDTSGTFEDRYLDVTVQITADTKTAFAHLVYPGPLQNTVTTVTRVRPRQPLAHGYAIVALNDEDCSGQQNGASFHGSAIAYVSGGGVFSNGCMRGDGGPIVDATGQPIQYVGETHGDFTYFTPQPEQVSDPIDPDTYAIDPPDCSGLPNYGTQHGGSTTIYPGNYTKISVNSGGDDLFMEPGLYCIWDKSLWNGGTVTGYGVTIYLADDFTIDGNVTVNLSAPAEYPDPSPALPGVLFYVPMGADTRMQLNGNGSSSFTGLIYAPGANVDLLGNGFVDAYKVQIIGWNVQVGGEADTFVHFDDSHVSTKPTYLELYK